MKGFLNPKGIHKKFARKLFPNKLASRGGFGILTLGIFGAILAAPRRADAFLGDIIGNAIFEILVGAMLGITSVIFSIVMLIVNSLVYTAVWIMRYVVEYAINLSINFAYTSGPIFDSGWPVLRDLANMGLILILVGIGVGTMLNLKLNKSRLPMFFLVALLINLTPIITGVIIDFSNIIANVFFASAKNALSAAVGNSPIDYAVRHGQSIIDNATTAAKDGLFSMAVLGNIVMPIMATVVGVVLIFIFGLLTALFLARIVALLILVILSPVAFLGLIFGGGKWKKTLWDNWWDNFIKWSIIVIPLIFFLWLGGIFFNASPTLCDPTENTLVGLGVSDELQEATGLKDVVDPDGTSLASPLDVFICQTSVTFFAIVAMVVGVMISFKSSAAGAGVVINRAKSIQKAAKKKTRESAGRYARKASANVAGQAGTQIAGSRAAGIRGIGAPLKTLGRKLQNVEVQQRTEWRKYSKNYSGMTLDQKLAHTKSERDPDKIIALWDTIRREQLDQVDAIRANPGDNRVTDDDINRYLQHAHYRTDEKGEDISKEWLRTNPQDALLSAIGESVAQVERRYLQATSQDINKMTASALANQASQRLLENDDFKTRQLQIIVSNDDKRYAFQPHLRTSVTRLSGGTANTGPDRITYLSGHADKRLQAMGDAASANPNLARTF